MKGALALATLFGGLSAVHADPLPTFRIGVLNDQSGLYADIAGPGSVEAARMAGAFVRRARNQWESVKAELERELETERVKADLDAAVGAAQAPMRELEDTMRQLERDADGTPARDDAAASSAASA